MIAIQSQSRKLCGVLRFIFKVLFLSTRDYDVMQNEEFIRAARTREFISIIFTLTSFGMFLYLAFVHKKETKIFSLKTIVLVSSCLGAFALAIYFGCFPRRKANSSRLKFRSNFNLSHIDQTSDTEQAVMINSTESVTTAGNKPELQDKSDIKTLESSSILTANAAVAKGNCFRPANSHSSSVVCSSDAYKRNHARQSPAIERILESKNNRSTTALSNDTSESSEERTFDYFYG